ncbi:response regulator [Mesorhizobium sp. LHD-90]|uniref:response regulator n=1 Tax=Mesorhizobium sp. LHD-90 TaxID=3071414 RepID=UPI0027E04D3B|nr:response regulator [Mesorhizobium sp. LHD-90]MDQ6436154.1 response regulator [Mesorhizobium sp. LHD-90]
MPIVAAATGRARILAVDDDERNLLAVREVLDPVGDVVCAHSGEEALRCLLKEDFAVVLLDVLMPGMDGYETANLIRQRERSKRTPIIFLSAINKEEAHMLRGYDAGAVDYVFKPFDTLILRSKVAVFVDLYEKTREIEEKAAREQGLLEAALQAQAEKLEAEHALRRSKDQQEAILRSLPVVFHSRSTDEPFGPLFVSDGVEALTGFTSERFLSEPDFGVSRVHPEDRERVAQAHRDAASHGSYSCEYRWQAADGSWKIFLDQGVLAPAEEDRQRALFGTLLDITERRQLEEQVAHTRKIETIGQLTGGIAHDFNNLLASILSGLSLMERQVKLPDNARQVLEMTRHAARQGVDLINRMLAFSRRQRLSPTTVHLPKLAETLEGLLAPVLGGRIRLHWKISADIAPALADKGQLELAIMNLVLNARDAMPQGGTITLGAWNSRAEAASGLDPGDYVVISVEDTGVGIAPELLDKVVEPFFTTKEVGKGTGLGLSTVYGFAQQSRGALQIQSEVGRGTRVELWLPCSDEADIPAIANIAPASDMPRLEREKAPDILLVDDSESLREITAAMLRDRGFMVVTATGGAEALAWIEREPDRFDLIVTDFAMPLVSGLDVVRFARGLRSGWPAIIISGYADATAMKDRPDDVPLLGKPYPDEALVDMILELLKRSRHLAVRQGSG